LDDPQTVWPPRIESVAEAARVSIGYTHKVLAKYRRMSLIENPDLIKIRHTEEKKNYSKITPDIAIYLLALRANNDQRPLYKYKTQLMDDLGKYLAVTTIHNFFLERYDHKGSLRSPNLVPLDKFRHDNVAKYHEFMAKLAMLPNHHKYHFIDEKHLVNKDCIANRVHADPLTGRVWCIQVSGDFRMAYNLIVIAIITASLMKTSPPVHYVLGEDNGTAANFTAYITYLITVNWFEIGDILIMDNAAIHCGAEATILEDLLWTTLVNGVALNVLIVYLPARAPELNPIELVFHILARRLRLWRYRTTTPQDVTVSLQVQRVFHDMDLLLIMKCCMHCGY
jgi:transposase